MPQLEKLLVVARVNHYRHNGRLYSYGPYAREIDVWADLFPRVTIAGPCRDDVPPGDCTPFTRRNIEIAPICESGGDGLKAKLQQAVLLPKTIAQLVRAMKAADAIHVRCPCDLGLLGVLFAPIFSRYLIAKYATQWIDYPGEPSSWRLQRTLLKSHWWGGVVTVYGEHPNQPPNVMPFFTSMLTDEQINQARIAAATPRDPREFRILFVGRLSESKNVDVLIRAVAALKVPSRQIKCLIVGEGYHRKALEALATTMNANDRITFAGGLDFPRVLTCYKQAHALVLVSDIEGWPKAIAEAMAFGVVCIGTANGIVPQMLGSGRGLVIPPRDSTALRQALEFVAQNPDECSAMATRSAAWAQKYSLDGLREALRKLMNESWSVPFPPTKSYQPETVFSK